MCVSYSRREWIADAVVHVVGVTTGLMACIAMAVIAMPGKDLRIWIALSLYGAALMTMLGCSALYNMTGHEGRKELYRRLDHAAIFVMIAGTYTPFALLAIGGAWGMGLLAFVWTTAMLGATLKILLPRRFERLSLAVYLLLGWSVLVALDPLLASVSLSAIVLLLIGGLLYSVGVVFHLWDRLPFQNAIWHAFVLAAAACHYAAVLGGVAAIA